MSNLCPTFFETLRGGIKKKGLDISRSYEINGWTFICMPFFGLKDITNLDDFNQVVDWQNSSFYQATNQSSSVIS